MSVTCSQDGPVKRTLEMPGVGKRTYHLYIPPSLCSGTDGDDDEASSPNANNPIIASDTVPLVLALHCYGGTARTMMHLTKIADEYSFVMVIPEGMSSSWNSKYCCGYALDNDIDDVGFLSKIIRTVEDDTGGLVTRDATYGIGWSNGGYMVTYAAGLFRAIAPISGHIYNVREDIFPTTADRDVTTTTAIFMHHSVNDQYVRMTGCCTNSSMPKCCCGISQNADICVSAEGVLRSWAVDVNGCSSASGSAMSISREDGGDGVTCHTISGDGCRANATICIHSTEGHFNSPSFEAAFRMQNDIGDFFARDACLINRGTWSAEDRSCTCEAASVEGRYCLVDGIASSNVSEVDGTERPFSSTSFVLILVCGAVVPVLFLALQWVKRLVPRRFTKASEVRKDVEMGSLMTDRDLRSY